MIIIEIKKLELYKNAMGDVNQEYQDWQYDLDTTAIVKLVKKYNGL